jgi:hypothetical protein
MSRSIARAAALAAAFGCAAPVGAQATWPTETWNPSPMQDDLILPLPCGGAMAFRPIPVPVSSGALADRAATLGQSDPDTDFAEYLRTTFIAGPFLGPDGQPPRFYLAKTEVTRDQWQAVMTEPCPSLPAQGGRVPQAEVSWGEAVAFTTRLTAFLMRTARDRLPRRDDAIGFIRLPTEDEWEYAARGGATVSEAEFGSRTYPMEGGMQRHAWFQGPRSAAGRARPVGTREPNPLGLFDIYGNVAEWALEPFRLNKVGRPHGLAGGMVARGGDFLTPESALRSSLRVELPPFNVQTGEPLRLRSVGLRPAIGLVATTADGRITAFRDAFAEEAQSRSGAAEDPARLLQVLREDATDPTLRQGIERVQATLRAEARARADQERLTMRSQIEAAASLARQVSLADGNRTINRIAGEALLQSLLPQLRDAWASADQREELLERLLQQRREAGARAERQQMRQAAEAMAEATRRIGAALTGRADEVDRALPQLITSYLRVINRVGQSTDRLRIADEARVVEEELRGQGVPQLPELARLAARHMVLAAGGNAPSPERAVRDIVEAAATAQAAPPQPRR